MDTQFGTGKQVQWVSPTGGWFDAALGDFNADGDLEIVTIKGDHDASRLTIFDPVVSSGPINLDQQFNGIYWDTLYDTSLPGTPDLVATGKFNPGVPGVGDRRRIP